MSQCFEQIVTQAKVSYNLEIHAILWLSFGFSNLNLTRIRMDFSLHHRKVAS